MGWFDDEEIFHAAISTSQLFDKEVNPILNAVAAAIFTDGDQHNYVMAAHYNSLTLLLNRYLHYAKDPSKFPPGLPTSKVSALAIADDTVLPILEGIVGEPIVIIFARAGAKKADITVYIHMQDNYNWNEFDNIATIGGTDYEYIDFEWETYVYIYWDENGLPIIETRNTGYLLINFTAIVGGAPRQEKMYFGLFHEDLWLHVQYTIISEDIAEEFRPYYWMYNSSQDTTYPELSEEALTAVIEIPSEYYPIITLMREGDFIPDVIEDPNDPLLEVPNPEFEAADGLLHKIHFGMQDFIDALTGEDLPEDEEKPDLDKVDDISFLFAIDVYTEVEASIEYLYYLFEDLSINSTVGYTEYEDSLIYLDTGALPSVNYFEISEGDFNITLQYNYMTINKDVVNEGDPLVDKYTKTIVVRPRHTYSFDNDGFVTITVVADSSTVSIKKRTSSTTYDEYIIHGPIVRTKIRALDESKWVYRHLVTEDAESGETGDPRQGFFFPVSFTIADNLNIIHNDTMIYDSMMLVIYAADIEVIKWYEKGIFKILLQIIIVVAMVVLTLAFGPGALTFMNVVTNSLIALVTSFVVSIALDLLVELVGGKLAVLIAVVAVLVKAYLGNWAGFADLPFAEQLLQATQLITKVVNTYTSVSGSVLEQEVEDFLKDAKERQEEIDEKNEWLEGDSSIDPLYIQREVAIQDPYEDPSDFYERTIHIGNPGVLSLDAIQGYVDSKLLLPDFDPKHQFASV